MTRTRVDIRVRYPRAEYRFPRDRSRCFAAHDGMDREEDNEQEEKKEGNGGKKQERERESRGIKVRGKCKKRVEGEKRTHDDDLIDLSSATTHGMIRMMIRDCLRRFKGREAFVTKREGGCN